jgi:hypothetical protein
VKQRDLRNGFQDANGRHVKEGDEVEYRFGTRRGMLTYCGHDGAAWVHFFDSGKDEDVNWCHLAGVPKP